MLPCFLKFLKQLLALVFLPHTYLVGNYPYLQNANNNVMGKGLKMASKKTKILV